MGIEDKEVQNMLMLAGCGGNYCHRIKMYKTLREISTIVK